jgi:serine/threonine-protein kinase RsbW
MAELPNVRLNVSNRSENVLLVREALTGLGETVDLDSNDLNDIRTAVTEACNNVVMHAYGGKEGPLEVEVFVSASAIEVVVRDHGMGIRPRMPAAEDTAAGIGLPVIQALAQRVEFMSSAGYGTEVRMEFATPSGRPLESFSEDALELPAVVQAGLAATAEITIAPTRLAHAVLPRLMSVLAARAQFSTDRISDAQLVADALVAHAPESISGSHLSVGISVEPRNLALRVGPLLAGSARALVVNSAVEGLGPVIETLTDDHQVAGAGASEMLALQLVDHP